MSPVRQSVSQPYVVRLFGTKENLFLAALGNALDRLLDRLPQRAERGRPARAGRAAWAQTYLDLLEVRGLHQILSHAFLLGAHPVIGPAARGGFAQVWRFLRDEAGFTAEEAQKFLAMGMLINTMVGLRMTEDYGKDAGMTELFDECFPLSIQMVLEEAPRVDEPW